MNTRACSGIPADASGYRSFHYGTGFQFFAFMQLVQMYTGVGPMPFVCLISLALELFTALSGVLVGALVA